MYQLDCTLRDGGYYTKWDFSSELVANYLKTMNELPIDFLEIGYVNPHGATDYYGQYYYLPDKTIDFVRSRSSKSLAVMIDGKKFYDSDVGLVTSRLKNKVQLIRVATPPQDLHRSIELCKRLKNYGFTTAINLMYLSSIVKADMFVSDLRGVDFESVDYLNFVDSYGSVLPFDLARFAKKVEQLEGLPTLGFHGHDNLNLAFANTLVCIDAGWRSFDTTVQGMGRGAGNLKTELLLSYRQSKYSEEVDLARLGSLLETFAELQQQYGWGTNLAYIFSGFYELPQKKVMDALELGRYSLPSILNSLDTAYDMDLPKLGPKAVNKMLLVGGGESTILHLDPIRTFLERHKDVEVIHSSSRHLKSFVGIPNKSYLVAAGNEVAKAGTDLPENFTVVHRPRPRNFDVGKIEGMSFELSFFSMFESDVDSPLAIALEIAHQYRAKTIYVVGFDGYKNSTSQKDIALNKENQNIIYTYRKFGKLTFLTDSEYDGVEKKSIYEFMSDYENKR